MLYSAYINQCTQYKFLSMAISTAGNLSRHLTCWLFWVYVESQSCKAARRLMLYNQSLRQHDFSMHIWKQFQISQTYVFWNIQRLQPRKETTLQNYQPQEVGQELHQMTSKTSFQSQDCKGHVPKSTHTHTVCVYPYVPVANKHGNQNLEQQSSLFQRIVISPAT